MNIYRAIIARLKKSGYFKIHPVVRSVVIQGFGGTMIMSIPYFWANLLVWPVAPLVMVVLLVIKEILDDMNSGKPTGIYLVNESPKHLLQSCAGVLLAIFILIAVTTERGIL